MQQSRAGGFDQKQFFLKEFRPLLIGTYVEFFTEVPKNSAKARKFIQ
jgi:hypothetical protein